MNKNNYEITSIEQKYVNELTDDEKVVYLAGTTELKYISHHLKDYDFVQVSMLLNELHTEHTEYNLVLESEQQDLIDLYDEKIFNTTITIGQQSHKLSLSCMDSCDPFYCFLATFKMNSFTYLLDYYEQFDCLVELINEYK